jgi:hypothetical protein
MPMSKLEAEARAKVMASNGRIIEAGYINDMRAPEGLTEAQSIIVRMSYFFGAKHIIDLLDTASSLPDGMFDKAIARMRDEMDVFGEEMADRQKKFRTEHPELYAELKAKKPA